YYKRNPTGSQIPSALNLTAFIEGFYNPASNNMISDTTYLYLRNNSFPYNITDSSKGILNSSGTGVFNFLNAVNSVNYYLVIKHRNSIEIWSKNFVSFTSGTLTYDFSNSASKAFGDNQKNVDSTPLRFAIYSGDVNQDGTIDAGDLSAIENDAGISIFGYVSTDITGDDAVDASDISLVENNALLGVNLMAP
ncbi:MAG TPA: dockerin type I domain-containing protein, partial [Ignavibacteria bacterium]|nr:dockerin type I domain-containing protein [Ignavibacteria bacterium]